MGTESEVVTLTIEVKDAAVDQEGFDVPLIAAIHEFWPERVRTFEALAELTAAPLNVPTDHPIYINARALKSQKPAPTRFKVGKRLSKGAPQIVTLSFAAPTAGAVYSIRVDGTLVTYTAADTDIADVLDELGDEIGDVAGLSVEAESTRLIVTGSPAEARHSFEPVTGNIFVNEISAATSDVPIATDLDGIRAADDGWYTLHLDTTSKADLLAAAAWAETQRVLLLATVSDSNAKQPSPDGESGPEPIDVLSALQTAGYQRTVPVFHERPATQAAAAAWAGRLLPKAIGSATWANMALAGVDKSVLSATEREILKSRNGNYYIDIKGIGFTIDGRAAGGRFVDITQGMDWFDVRTQERVVGLFANNDKVPYTDKGIELIRAQVLAQILEGITAGVIDGDLPYDVTVPTAASVSPNDKITRVLPNVKFNFVIQGAVHKVAIAGTVLVAL